MWEAAPWTTRIPGKHILISATTSCCSIRTCPGKGWRRTMFTRMLLDGISALRFLLQGDFRDFLAVASAHAAFYGMKRYYRGTKNRNNLNNNNVIVIGIYPRSIVADFFLRGKKQFGAPEVVQLDRIMQGQ